jgi:hypothetical protein
LKRVLVPTFYFKKLKFIYPGDCPNIEDTEAFENGFCCEGDSPKRFLLTSDLFSKGLQACTLPNKFCELSVGLVAVWPPPNMELAGFENPPLNMPPPDPIIPPNRFETWEVESAGGVATWPKTFVTKALEAVVVGVWANDPNPAVVVFPNTLLVPGVAFPNTVGVLGVPPNTDLLGVLWSVAPPNTGVGVEVTVPNKGVETAGEDTFPNIVDVVGTLPNKGVVTDEEVVLPKTDGVVAAVVMVDSVVVIGGEVAAAVVVALPNTGVVAAAVVVVLPNTGAVAAAVVVAAVVVVLPNAGVVAPAVVVVVIPNTGVVGGTVVVVLPNKGTVAAEIVVVLPNTGGVAAVVVVVFPNSVGVAAVVVVLPNKGTVAAEVIVILPNTGDVAAVVVVGLPNTGGVAAVVVVTAVVLITAAEVVTLPNGDGVSAVVELPNIAGMAAAVVVVLPNTIGLATVDLPNTVVSGLSVPNMEADDVEAVPNKEVPLPNKGFVAVLLSVVVGGLLKSNGAAALVVIGIVPAVVVPLVGVAKGVFNLVSVKTVVGGVILLSCDTDGTEIDGEVDDVGVDVFVATGENQDVVDVSERTGVLTLVGVVASGVPVEAVPLLDVVFVGPLKIEDILWVELVVGEVVPIVLFGVPKSELPKVDDVLWVGANEKPDVVLDGAPPNIDVLGSLVVFVALVDGFTVANEAGEPPKMEVVVKSGGFIVVVPNEGVLNTAVLPNNNDEVVFTGSVGLMGGTVPPNIDGLDESGLPVTCPTIKELKPNDGFVFWVKLLNEAKSDEPTISSWSELEVSEVLSSDDTSSNPGSNSCLTVIGFWIVVGLAAKLNPSGLGTLVWTGFAVKVFKSAPSILDIGEENSGVWSINCGEGATLVTGVTGMFSSGCLHAENEATSSDTWVLSFGFTDTNLLGENTGETTSACGIKSSSDSSDIMSSQLWGKGFNWALRITGMLLRASHMDCISGNLKQTMEWFENK